ncbi:MAG: GNAT family N-acetyltransferase [Bacteroidetes bacterium]|nr:GNAT family N-acetyltransferase [Bacteroidota bacterium]
MLRVFTRTFNELSNTELYELLKLRSEVFVVEQNCVFLDMDDKDQEALHVLGFDGKRLVAYTRLLAPGHSYPEASIGRVVSHPSARGMNYGREIMQYSIQHILKQYQTDQIVISAQLYLKRFYSELGFVAEGEVYPEDDIPHIKMRYTC